VEFPAAGLPRSNSVRDQAPWRRCSAQPFRRKPSRLAATVAIAFCLVTGAAPAYEFRVGTFTKTSATAPVTQTIAHGLGRTPKALILYAGYTLNPGTFDDDYGFGIGFTDGTTSKSVSTSSDNGAGVSEAYRRMANKAFTIVREFGDTRCEADLSSWDATNFTLNWTTNETDARTIHWIAFTGPNLSAKVIEWTTGTTTGNRAVTGVGFRPAFVLTAHGGSGFTSTLPNTVGNGAVGLGAMDASGNQWANAVFVADGSGTSDTQRGQQTDACIYAFSAALSVTKEASFVSMDSDGFTVNFSTANASDSRMLSLAMTGLNVKVGSFSKSTGSAPASQSVTGVGFRNRVVLLSSFQDVAQASPVTHARFGLGACDGTSDPTSESSLAFQDTDGLDTTSTDRVDSSTKVFVKVNNDTPAIDAEADITGLDADGFTLTWTTNDAVATQIGYVSFGFLTGSEVEMASAGGSREDDGVLIEWRTGREVDNLGFHVYREEAKELVRLTDCLLAGSALWGCRQSELSAGRWYSYFDPVASNVRSPRYWIEDIDLNGTRTLHGPIVAVAKTSRSRKTGPKVLRAAPPPTLADLAAPGAAPLDGSMGLDRRAVPPVATPERLSEQRRIAQGTAAKLSVRSEGWYRIGQPEIAAAGICSGIDPRRLRLYAGGREIPIRVDGESDGRFDPRDSIEFYGMGLDSPFTGSRTYWLVDGPRRGRRLEPAKVVSEFRGRRADPPPPPASFPFTVEERPRSIYFAALRNGEAENFFGPVVGSETVEVVLSLHHVDPAPQDAPVLEVALQGVTTGPHRVQVVLSGSRDRGAIEFNDQESGYAEFPLAPEWLGEGEIVVALTARGGEGDVSLLDFARLTYAHTFTADGDRLRFTVPGGTRIAVRGFATPNVRVIDVTDPDEPRSVEARTRRDGPQHDGEGHGIQLAVPGHGVRTLFAFGEGARACAEHVSANRPSRWHKKQHGADLVIVARGEFATSLAPLKSLRESEGLTVAIVDIDDLYDEFSFGEKNPRAVKDFLARVREVWKRPPRFLLLVGDATFDPRGYLGSSEADLLPTWTVDTEFLETASDDWFADFDDDGVPELAVGRLPVHTSEEAARVVSKLVSYAEGPGGEWTRRALFVADDTDLYDFGRATEGILSALPAGLDVREISLDATDAGTAREEILSNLAAGQLLVNYLGHGSVEMWAREQVLTVDDLASLGNGPRLPMVVAMNCLNGFFHDLYTESLAEGLLLAPQGGALAVWASSGLTHPHEQSPLDRAFLESLFAEKGVRLGEAVQQAKARTTDRDARRTWILFGDPSARLRE